MSGKNTKKSNKLNPKESAGFIDMTPTWQSIIMTHVWAAINGEERETRVGAMEEILRCAEAADKYNKLAKKGKIKKD